MSTLSLASDARSFQSGNISLNPAAEGQRLLWQDLDLVGAACSAFLSFIVLVLCCLFSLLLRLLS